MAVSTAFDLKKIQVHSWIPFRRVVQRSTGAKHRAEGTGIIAQSWVPEFGLNQQPI